MKTAGRTETLYNAVERKLAYLNATNAWKDEKLKAKSFYLTEDKELEGVVASVILIVNHRKVHNRLEAIDRHLSLVNDELQGSIVFTDVIYRTPSEYKSGFENVYWSNTLKEVGIADAAEQQPFLCSCCGFELGLYQPKNLTVQTCGVQIEIDTRAVLVCECGCSRRWYAQKGKSK